MMYFRTFGIGLLGTVLTACANIGVNGQSGKSPAGSNSTPPPAQTTNGLAAQELKIGECGIFLFTDTAPRNFVFFQKQDEPTAKYYGQGREIRLTTVQNTGNLADNVSFDIQYSHEDYAKFQVKGDFTEPIEGGLRINNARIKSQKLDAWDEIQPVSGVYVCQS